MTFEYGSIDLGIRNPFKIEGMIRAVKGIIIAGLGLYCLLTVSGLVEHGERLKGWLTLGAGILLLGTGLTALGRGIFQVMRFFVGRGAPTSLAKNLAKSEVHAGEINTAYDAKHIEQMMQGRKNVTFTEPITWFARLVHSLFPSLLYLPYTYRRVMVGITQGLVQTLFAFLCYSLAWFSGTTGLTDINNTPVLNWLAVFLTIYLFFIWCSQKNPLLIGAQKNNDGGLARLVIWITAAVLLPFGLMYVNNHIVALPDITLNAGRFIFLISFLAVITTAITTYLVYLRMQKVTPKTEVAEMRANWQESIHPQEIFINFENIVMANRRFREVPNRVYREFDAGLIEEGSDDKGRFSGEIIQETQPVFRPLPVSERFNQYRIGLTFAAHILMLVGAFWIFMSIDTLSALEGAAARQQLLPVLSSAVYDLLTATILLIFGRILVSYAHTFWAEMQFESLLVYFQCRGTYTESKLSTGTSIYDSTRSENTVVRSSMTPWVLACRIISSCFTESGHRNLEQPRYILEMHRADHELNTIIQEIREFITERETIATLKSEKDLTTTAGIYHLNQRTRVDLDDQIDTRTQALLDHERAAEFTGADEG